MKKYFLIPAILLYAAGARAQAHANDNLWYNNGAAVYAQSGSLITVQGDMTNNQAGVTGITHLDNSGFIWVQGNLYGDNAFTQAGTGTVRLQNKTALYTAPYAAEGYQVIQGGYRVNGGKAATGAAGDGSFYSLELDNQAGLVFIKTNTDVRSTVDFKPASATADGNTIAPNGTVNRLLTYDPGTGASPSVAPANGAAYTAVFGMMNSAAGNANFKNVSTNLTTNTTVSDNAYIQGKLRRALEGTAGGSYGFPLGLEPSTSGTAARGIQYTNFTFGASNYDVLTGYFQQGSDNTVVSPGTVCGLNSGFIYYGSSNHGEWIFTPQAASAESYNLTIYPQDYGTVSSVKYFITKDNAVPVPGTQSCGTSPLGLSVTGIQSFSEFGFAGASTVVPVTLKSFTYIRDKCVAELQWTTASEQNVSHFELQQSLNQIDWQAKGNVAAAGNSSAEQSYSQKISLAPGVANYFRLKTVDNDGRYSLSDVRKVSCSGTAEINIYPNPASDAVTVDGITAGSTLILSDVSGKIISEKRAAGTYEKLQLKGLASGIYFLRAMQQDGSSNTFKVYKK